MKNNVTGNVIRLVCSRQKCIKRSLTPHLQGRKSLSCEPLIYYLPFLIKIWKPPFKELMIYRQ